MRQGIVEEEIPKCFAARLFLKKLHEPVETGGDRHHLGQRGCRIDPVEQGERQPGVLPRIGGHTLFAHPARFLALDRGGHQPVGNHPSRYDQRGLPPQIEGIAPRRAPQRIAATLRHADTTRRILNHAMIGEMRKKSRLPPRAPAIGAGFVAEISSGGQAGVGFPVERGGVVHRSSFSQSDRHRLMKGV
ncbi:MAG: hypothetical protein IPM67_09455 [Sphingomonadales bacterium]|nr:hypothetical protein [Sphingomonadales bacterium]MBK9268848.1 hypothetical protein [Sphingomonadales bacterium]